MPPRLRHNPITSISSLTPLPSLPPSICLLTQSRHFTTTPQVPSQRSAFFSWVDGPGAAFKQADDDGPKYISSYDKHTWERKDPEKAGAAFVMPYPLNRAFRSQPVLSNGMRDEIYRRVQIQGQSVRQVSAELAVSLERVAAVVRLKAVEREWVDNGKHISNYLTSALERMLPITHLSPYQQQQEIHENIQELPSHPLASRQAFVPVSESREYTRVDAGKEFGLPPADEVVPLPELIVAKREKINMLSESEKAERKKERDRIAQEKKDRQNEEAVIRAREEKVVEQGRWKWKLKEARAGQVGFRYGYPFPDRKKGHIKIPKFVA